MKLAPQLSEGTKRAGGPVSFVPSPSPGWTWPFGSRPWRQRRFGRTRKGGWLYPVALLVFGVPRHFSPRRPSIPIRFSCLPSIRRPSKTGAWIPPVARYDPKIARSAGSESRAGSLEVQVSLDFRCPVSLGLLTFGRNRL